MATYKSFTYNLVGDPAPWGTIENQLDKDIIDTLVIDCLTAGKDAVNGHRHIRFYDGSGNTVIFSSGTDLHLDASLCVIESETQITDGVNTLSLSTGSSAAVIESDNVDLKLKAPAANSIICDTAKFFRLPVKTDTGDPSSPSEGDCYINTFDNAVRLYADSAWRSIFTW